MRPARHQKLWNCRPACRVIHIPGHRDRTARPPKAERQHYCARRDVLGDAQHWICALCGQRMKGKRHRFSQDHVIPRDLGGKDALGNLVLAHRDCNTAKANDIPTGCELVWLMFVNARLGASPLRY